MRRNMTGGTRVASMSSGKQVSGGGMTRRSVSIDENGKGEKAGTAFADDDGQQKMAGPVTARLKLLEKKYSQVLEMQAKFNLLDKWIQQQFGLRLFPPPVVNMEKFSERNPEDADNPFYAVYLLIQRLKVLEEKVKTLEARPFEDISEAAPTSNYSSAHAFRNFRGRKVATAGAVKRGYAASAPTTPKKAKMAARPTPPSATYPFKPSVKILPRDPNTPSPIKKEVVLVAASTASPSKSVSPTKPNEKIAVASPEVAETSETKTKENKEGHGNIILGETPESGSGQSQTIDEQATPVKVEVIETPDNQSQISGIEDTNKNADDGLSKPTHDEDVKPEISEITSDSEQLTQKLDMIEEPTATSEDLVKSEKMSEEGEGEIPQLEEVMPDDAMDIESELEDADQKPTVPMEEDPGDVSGSEASVSSLASSSSKLRLSTRRQAAAAATVTSGGNAGKEPEDEKPVMYTARGRRHTVPRRYAEFTGHDNVVSILKSQQRAEKSAGTTKGGKRQTVVSSKLPDTPPKIKKMVKSSKTPSPKKATMFADSDGEGEGQTSGGSAKKKSTQSGAVSERPASVDALVERVMAREVDSDGMVVLSESYPNIFVNQQQLVTVIVRSNGKSTRLTRKMTTLVFEDSVLASASPFGTKYYKDRLPPEPLEAMVDFIADSGFEPHYSKKKIYMIVGQVCNEARAGRVSRKFMHPLEATPGTSTSTVTSQQLHDELGEESEEAIVQSTELQS